MKWDNCPGGCKIGNGWARGKVRAKLFADGGRLVAVMCKDEDGYWFRGRAKTGPAPDHAFFGPFGDLDAAKAAAVFAYRVGELA